MKLIIRKPDKHINDELLEILITELVKTTCQYFTCIDQIENSKIDYDYIENYIISTLHTHFVSYLKEKINDIDNYGLSKEFITETITVFENFNYELTEHRFLFQYVLIRNIQTKTESRIEEQERTYVKSVASLFSKNLYVFTMTLKQKRENLIFSTLLEKSEPITKNNLPSRYFDKHLAEIATSTHSNTIADYKLNLEMNCEAFETEVIENFLCLDQEDRRFYWNKLHNESFRMKPRQETDSISFEALLERFNVVNLEEEIMSDSVLSEILNHTRKEYLEIDGNLGLDEFYNIHEAFICYYQNKFFNELLIFIDKQYFDSSVSSNTIPLKTIEPIPHKKLKVNITVPQLTFLFKMLNDLKPDIFDITAKTELSNFIADNFITKATEKAGIKSGSVYNLFTDTDKSTAIFWSEKLVKMLQVARQV